MSGGESKSRHDRLQTTAVEEDGSSLWAWTSYRHPLRIVLNYVIIACCRICPSLRLKNFLYRTIGVSLGPRVAWGLEATPDVFWPELITIEEDAIIGYDATILCHEFLQDGCRTGPVRIGPRAMIGAQTVVLPGVRIGADARVAANSLVTADVPPGETVGGVPARPMAEDNE